jgi:uncharacterized repeat protein (TIGR01451 family)
VLLFCAVVFLAWCLCIAVAGAAEKNLTSETFTNATTVPGVWTFGGSTCLTAGTPSTTVPGSVPPCSKTSTPIDPPGGGVLRFTPNTTYTNGFIIYNNTIASNAGLVAVFDYFAWGGTGADGLSFFFLDGTQPTPTQPGAVGGALGYAQNCSTPGVAAGYVGLGLDEYGNYSQGPGFECHSSGPGFIKNTIALRGQQSANYPYLGGYNYPPGSGLPFSLSVPNVSTRPAGERVRITLTTSLYVSVEIDTFDGRGYVTYIQPFFIGSMQRSNAFPPLFRFGYAGSTGASTNYHELRNVVIDTAPPVLTMTKTHTGNFSVGGNGQFALTVSNVGGSTTAGVTSVVDTLPAGLTYQSATGSGWGCSAIGQKVTCTSSATIAPSTESTLSSFPPITLNVGVGAAAAPSAQNVAVATGGGATNSYTATDTVAVNAPNLTLTKSHTGNFQLGGQGTYTLQAANTGTVTTIGPLTLVDTLPSGLTYASATGTNWSCSSAAQTVTCTYAAAVAAGGAASPLALTVGVAANAPNSVTNTAVVSGGSAPNAATANDPTTIVRPALAITKTHAGNFVVGQQGTYTLTVSNNGPPATIGAITVTDTLPAQLAYVAATGTGWTCGASAQVVTCTSSAAIAANASAPPITLAVAVSAPAPTTVTNTASAAGGGATNTPTASDPTTIVANVALTLTKSHSGSFVVGQTGTYALLLGNSGGIPTTGTVTLVDTLPAGLSYQSASGNNWTCGAAGQIVTCTYAAAIAAGANAAPLALVVAVGAAATPGVVNSATASGGGAANPVTATDPTAVDGVPNLIATKSHTGSFEVGQPATYTITVGNDGTAPTNGTPIVVTDNLPAGITYASGSGTGWTCQAGPIVGPGSFTCTSAGSLAVSNSQTFPPITLNVTPTAAGTVVNTISASGGGAPNTATASDTTVIAPPAVPPTLTLQKSHNGDFTVGTTGTFLLVAGNTGTVATAGTITLTDTLPAGLTYAGATGTNWTCPAASSSQTITCTYTAAIAAGGVTSTLTFNVNVLASVVSPATNTASASGGGAANTANASDTAIVNAPKLALSKSHAGSATIGAPLTYTLTVSNAGTAATTASVPVTVSDPLATGLQLTSASGTNWTCAAGVTVSCTTTTPIAAGTAAAPISVLVNVLASAYPSVKNTATAQGGGASNAATASDTVPVGGEAQLTLAKTHSGNFAVGTQGTFSLVAGNSGNTPTTGTITVSDPLPASLTYVSATGAGWTCAYAAPTVTCTTSASIVPNGTSAPIALTVLTGAAALPSVTNTATASGGGTSGTANASDTVSVVAAALALSKTHAGSFTVGQPGTFALVVSNAGNAATSGALTVTDTLPAGLTYASATGTGWTCSATNPQLVVCTSSAALAPGAAAPPITLTVNVAAAAVPSATNTATATNPAANNTATASDTVTIGGQAQISGLTKLVNGLASIAASSGDIVQYTIGFNNGGGAAATGVIVTDTFPAGIVPDPASVKLNGSSGGFTASLTAQTLTISIPQVMPNAAVSLTVNASVTATSSGTGLVNTATVSASNAQSKTSPPATVLVGTTNIVFDGSRINPQGQPLFPIAGATVALVNINSREPQSLTESGVTVNPQNANPFATTEDGEFVFALGQKEIGSPGQTTSYELVASATGYANRRILAQFTADPTGTVYSVTFTAQDGQPLATPGGYTLTAGPVTFTNVLNVFGNIPMFGSNLSITKTSDRQVASIGNRVVWTIAVNNASPVGLTNLVVTDVLPAGIAYAPGTARVDGAPFEPAISGRTLTWTFPSTMPAQSTHTIVIATVVAPGTSPGTLTNLATAAGMPQNTTLFEHASTTANVSIVSGVFGNAYTIVGRVIVATPDDGWTGPLTGVPGVRIVMEDGSSVVTDTNGRYSLPNVRPGLHVLRLDATSLPPGFRAFDDRRYDSPRSTEHLVHGISDTQLLQDVNFEVQAVK